ncbi:hypothetical protein [Nocardia phage NBR1]|uniref:hypothetical protein n=1 Tax=Nocardia phage NBR1 TaxID=1109711 RepID=UPI00023EEDEE|nr:hypothetical protein NoPhNBR1_gp43 [Nocardia phage NBR1]AEV52256.1 hypothetical protein [Nocardia phage NBR1]
MAGKANRDESVMVDGVEYIGLRADTLHGGHIGSAIRFHWLFPSSGVKATVEGELRQVYHTSGDTVLHLTSATSDTADLTEFVLVPSDAVLVPWEVA